MHTKEDFIKRLTFLRIKKNISAREMSFALDQNINYINSIENGKALPSLPCFFKICDFLEISPKDFFDFEIDDTEKFNQLLQDLRKLKSQDLISIENIVHSLAN